MAVRLHPGAAVLATFKSNGLSFPLLNLAAPGKHLAPVSNLVAWGQK